jgi:hypothetical protein
MTWDDLGVSFSPNHWCDAFFFESRFRMQNVADGLQDEARRKMCDELCAEEISPVLVRRKEIARKAGCRVQLDSRIRWPSRGVHPNLGAA